MTYEEWEEKYKPIQNHLVENASFEGTMFETYGKELEFLKTQDNLTIWTLIDNNDGEPQIIENGIWWVNRIGYFVSELPYYLGDYIQVKLT